MDGRDRSYRADEYGWRMDGAQCTIDAPLIKRKGKRTAGKRIKGAEEKGRIFLFPFSFKRLGEHRPQTEKARGHSEGFRSKFSRGVIRPVLDFGYLRRVVKSFAARGKAVRGGRWCFHKGRKRDGVALASGLLVNSTSPLPSLLYDNSIHPSWNAEPRSSPPMLSSA